MQAQMSLEKLLHAAQAPGTPEAANLLHDIYIYILILHCSTQETFTFQMNVVQVQPQKCLVQFECSSRLEKA